MVVTRMTYRSRKRTGWLWAGAAVCAAAFAGLWAYVHHAAREGGYTEADRAAADWVSNVLTGAVPLWKTVTAFGDTIPIIAVTLVLTFAAAVTDGWRRAIWLPLAAAASYGLNSAVKLAADRVRPSAAWGVEASGASFPSANAMMTCTILLLFAIIVHRSRRMPRWAAVVIWILAVAITALVGMSRLYFAVHYFTDISAGFALGGAVVFIAAALSARWG